MSPTAALRGSSLFAAMPESILGDLSRLMTPVAYQAGEIVFRQGDEGHHLLIVETGELEALRATPGGERMRVAGFGPGDVVGELSLLGDGRRLATVRAVGRASGWALERVAFDVLRHELRHEALAVAAAVGRLAVERLARVYGATAGELEDEPMAHEPDSAPALRRAPERPDAGYLATTLFFRDCAPTDIAQITHGLEYVEAPRGAVLERIGELPDTLWIVVRGAVETTLRGSGSARRLRLAGPGRAVGHVGLLGDPSLVVRREGRARERAVLLEVPWETAHGFLSGQARPARRFAAAFWTDTVRALEHAQRPMASLRASARERTLRAA